MHIGFPHYQNNGRVQPKKGPRLQTVYKNKKQYIQKVSKIYKPQTTTNLCPK